MGESRNKPIICVDFDGVIHSYDKGWQDGRIYGEVIEGFFDWAEKAKNDFKLVVYSSRSKDKELSEAMENWVYEKYTEWLKTEHTKKGLEKSNSETAAERLFHNTFEFSAEKPAAFVTIDDRAITFKGNWYSELLSPEALKTFKPWNKMWEDLL